MSEVAVLFKIYPKEGAMQSVVEAVKKLGAVGMQEQDVAFGIKVLKALFKFDDAKNGSSKIEEQIKGIEGVSEVEVEEESLV
ncbi:MAG: hypothetical protein ACP5RM_01140 [Candidatus Micrarchaeia archaeon]